MKRLIFFFLLFPAWLYAAQRVTLNQLQQGGWKQLNGQEVIITTPLIVCATYYDSITLAPERLYCPEERAEGLHNGDSTAYYQHAAYNDSLRIKLQCPRQYNLNLGATIMNLKARVTGVRQLQTGKTPHFRNYRPNTKLPDLNGAQIIVCAANIQNYFVHLGGYATRRVTEGQHALQTLKVATALHHINAHLYALCELEKGEAAPAELTNKMNELAHNDIYDYVRTGVLDGDTIAVAFIYDKRVLQPFGPLKRAYTGKQNIYRERFLLQGFQQTNTGERFVVSLNHLRSKRGNPDVSARKRNDNVNAILQSIADAYADSTYSDPDILLLGDYNSYTHELPIQTIIQAGYKDILMREDSLGYSYSYKGECGYLDRVFASPTMAEQITTAHPLHWNTDVYYSAAYTSKYNFKNRQIPNESPRKLRKILSHNAKRNIPFRYADHDPIIVGLKLK
ncbi:MAG: hypothetical protein IJS13_04050 [Paludibacteraceae bacterium]|nr:hypothetical protein [Paludibacteraceae bacterium]